MTYAYEDLQTCLYTFRAVHSQYMSYIATLQCTRAGGCTRVCTYSNTTNIELTRVSRESTVSLLVSIRMSTPDRSHALLNHSHYAHAPNRGPCGICLRCTVAYSEHVATMGSQEEESEVSGPAEIAETGQRQ